MFSFKTFIQKTTSSAPKSAMPQNSAEVQKQKSSEICNEQKFGSAVMNVGGYDNNLLFFKF